MDGQNCSVLQIVPENALLCWQEARDLWFPLYMDASRLVCVLWLYLDQLLSNMDFFFFVKGVVTAFTNFASKNLFNASDVIFIFTPEPALDHF